jgi:hypothetical protein
MAGEMSHAFIGYLQAVGSEGYKGSVYDHLGQALTEVQCLSNFD